jgi:site-specific recombinase XerD
MNAALPVEEAYRILTDEKLNGHLVLLVAKAAFDKVIHSHLFRHMFCTSCVVNVDVSYFQSYAYILQTV